MDWPTITVFVASCIGSPWKLPAYNACAVVSGTRSYDPPFNQRLRYNLRGEGAAKRLGSSASLVKASSRITFRTLHRRLWLESCRLFIEHYLSKLRSSGDVSDDSLFSISDLKNPSALREAYCERGLSIGEIARKAETTKRHVHYYMTKFGIERRPWTGLACKQDPRLIVDLYRNEGKDPKANFRSP